jgi:hypothetical protein
MHTILIFAGNSALTQFSTTTTWTSVVSVFFIYLLSALGLTLFTVLLIITRALAKKNYGIAAKYISMLRNPDGNSFFNSLDAICLAEKVNDYQLAEKILARDMKDSPSLAHHFLGVRIAIKRNDWSVAAARLTTIRDLYGNGTAPMEVSTLIAKTEAMINERKIDETIMDQLNLYKERFEKLIKNGSKIHKVSVALAITVLCIIIGTTIAVSLLERR